MDRVRNTLSDDQVLALYTAQLRRAFPNDPIEMLKVARFLVQQVKSRQS